MTYFDPLVYLLISVVPVIALSLWTQRPYASKLPTVNAFPGDLNHRKAHAAYMANARALIRSGFEKFSGPFRILTPLGSRVILPPAFSSWVKFNTNVSLSHSAVVEHDYLTWVPGFEGNKVIHEPNHIVIDVVRTKLSQNSKYIGIMHTYLAEVLSESWKADDDWHSVLLSETALDLLSRISAAVLVGPVLSRDPEWLQLTKTYTMNMFMGVRALRGWPALLQPMVHWFMKECKTCRAQVSLARRKIRAELARREDNRHSAIAQGQEPDIFNDGIAWVCDANAKSGQAIDPAVAQLAFALASLHTTTQLLQQSILDIAARPGLMDLLRTEISAALEQRGGWTAQALAQMQLLDSCIKETQRLKPGSLVNLERQAIIDTVMPNGVLLTRGTSIAVDTSAMWDPNVYESPEEYDGHRFLQSRNGTAGATQLASSSEAHFAFGLGQSICPGRFLVATEIKLVLAEMIMGWDVRLRDGTSTKVTEFGFEMLSNPDAVIEVRARSKA